MSDYKAVTEALAAGADPQMLCATCPWDRLCISPPSMTRQDIEKQQKEAEVKDKQHAAEAKARGESSMPFGTLLTVMTLSGRDIAADVCPVVAMRMRSSQGRGIVDALRSQMSAWDDQAG